MNKSVWSDNVKLPAFPELKENIKTDVVIIGGGICGILCAYYLKEAGVDYVLLEGSRIASGTTKNTTAKVTSQHGLIYDKLIKKFGKEKAKLYLEANQRAISEYEILSKKYNCDFERKSAYTYSMIDRRKVENEVKAVNSLGVSAEFTKKLELPFRTKGAIVFHNQAQINPIKLIAELSKNLNIYENTFVSEITSGAVVTKCGTVTAKNIIVATHFPFINRYGGYFLKLYQHRSYVSAYKNADKLEGMYIDEDLKGMSFKNYGDLLIVGGGGHRTGKEGEAWNGIDKFMTKYYPDAELKYRWAAQDCMSLDYVPYIGRYFNKSSDLFVATGFNKWGMTSSMVAAKILCDMIQNKKNEFREVFEPNRSVLTPQLFVNSAEATLNLLSLNTKRCPHLGCALKWNKLEHTWDCPCHGSRFESDGKLIDNPATKDLKNN